MSRVTASIHFLKSSFLGYHHEIPIYGTPADAGAKISVFFGLFGPQKWIVTVTTPETRVTNKREKNGSCQVPALVLPQVATAVLSDFVNVSRRCREEQPKVGDERHEAAN
ncbi:hypothetical protein C8R43DRAFT_952187 [Mycena crocata]|nr:hypothetical protein C8R43DRAFT_952187 [Mycena crocata]